MRLVIGGFGIALPEGGRKAFEMGIVYVLAGEPFVQRRVSSETLDGACVVDSVTFEQFGVFGHHAESPPHRASLVVGFSWVWGWRSGSLL